MLKFQLCRARGLGMSLLLFDYRMEESLLNLKEFERDF